MRSHPYLRAYMAGILVPTVFLLLVVAVFAIARYAAGLDLPIERALVFPLAVVPNLWGAWNALHLALRERSPLSLAAHGALLPLLLVPAGVMMTRALDVVFLTSVEAAAAVPLVMAVYYLLWKHLVWRLNAELGIL
ncbi:MAG: hypothetical protein ACRD1V_15310 [Vicinamibacterales bacterium]